MKILQINTSINFGSTGRIAEDIGKLLIEKGHQSYIAYGREGRKSMSEAVKIGTKKDIFSHFLKSRLLDKHGFGSVSATRVFIDQIERIGPDLIHLHNIHGYFLNIKLIFEYFKDKDLPVIWTFHDCWPFTGHCSYFDAVGCFKWQTQCYKCPNLKGYPESWMRDNSQNNYIQKKEIFTNLKSLTIITPSEWMAENVRNSFFLKFPVRTIHNGIDLSVFQATKEVSVVNKYSNSSNKYVLGVASIWDRRKGLSDFIKLRKLLPTSIKIVLVGLNRKQIRKLPDGIIGISRTESTRELSELYSEALVFVNPTYVDNFPTTNIEALSCGTPVITYNTGGSPESINEATGFIVQKGDIAGLANAISFVLQYGKKYYHFACRERAERLFDKNAMYSEYLNLYQMVIEKERK